MSGWYEQHSAKHGPHFPLHQSAGRVKKGGEDKKLFKMTLQTRKVPISLNKSSKHSNLVNYKNYKSHPARALIKSDATDVQVFRGFIVIVRSMIQIATHMTQTYIQNTL